MTTKRRTTLAKLTRPRLYSPLPRERLFRLLDAARQQPITWVAGPPGAGKTTLVASYLDARKTPPFWYQLDAGDADPATLFSYLVGLAAQRKRSKKAQLPYLTPEYLADIPGFARRFFRTLFSSFPPRGVLVLDNCQEAANPTLHQILVEATQEAPEGLRIFAISRSQPPLELARLKANHQLAELGWEDLKLSEEETAHILRRQGISESERIARIHCVADGWAGGVVLLSAHAGTDAEAPAISFSGKEAVFDYFAGQIFDRATQAERQVLMKTALLAQVTPETAVALSCDQSAPAVLDRLYRRQYFIDRRTEPQLSYRYHDLFREFLLNRAQIELDAPSLSALRLQVGRLLLAGGEAERAVELLCRGGHVGEAQDALLDRAPALLGQGRWQTLMKSIRLFPEAQVRASASLLYWRGMAHTAADPILARKDLEAALEMFQRAADAIGQITSIVGIITAHFVQDDAIAHYAHWIDPMATLFAQIDAWPAPAMELEARSVFLLAASHVRPDHPLLRSTGVRVLDLMDDERIESNTRTAAGLRALVFFMWTGDVESARRVDGQLETQFLAANALPVHIAMGYAFRTLYQHLTLGDSEAALGSAQRALVIARENGLANSECMAWQFQGIVNAGLGRDLDAAEAALRRVAARGLQGNLNRETIYHLAQAHVYKGRSDLPGALRHARLCLRAAREDCLAFLLIGGSNLANVFADAGEYQEARRLLDELYRLTQGTCFDNFGAALALEEAYLALSRNDHGLCHERLRQGLRLACSESRHAASLHYMGGSIPALFAEALENGIECEYVRELITRWSVPAPTQASAAWPWLLSVRTLGRFEVKLQGKRLEYGRKAPRKALALLKALIAFGGTDVPEQTLTDALWADEDGDAAHAAYAMTLTRLRKLLGDPHVLQQRASKLSLDRCKCWVDVWAFERCVKDVADPVQAALAVYGGDFLVEDGDAPWAASLRERLRSHFVRLISDAARGLEQANRHEEAARLYQRGLDTDNLAEAFYQGLMRCHVATGRTADATAVYLRLKQHLSIRFGLKPSAATERLYQSLRIR